MTKELDKHKNYYEVRNGYLANGLAFLGFRYIKIGFGKEATFHFEDGEELRYHVDKMIEMGNRLRDIL